MDYLGIAAIIVVVVGAVHFVAMKNYEMGRKAGVIEGRSQVLREDIIRNQDNGIPPALELLVETLLEVSDHSRSQIIDNKSGRKEIAQ